MATTEEERQEYLAELQAERDQLFGELQQTQSEIDALTDS